uniref:Sugar O-methyltransferase n=1 Tax=viral metagenome TaxID=1070528 RepID=A0A6C0L9H4_9ZZZZ
MYNAYLHALDGLRASGNISTFKSDHNYRTVLEHVSPNEGGEYLRLLRSLTDITEEEITTYCTVNDSIGSPLTSIYGALQTSPTNLRYILHAFLIMRHMLSVGISTVDIVEVGGGYGGLCLALHFFAKKYTISIASYTIVDLKEALYLQEKYLKAVLPNVEVTFVDASTFGSAITTQNMFLISNYCFSEISAEFQKQYIQTLFPKVSHGFMAWNFIPTYDFGFTRREEEEYPMTGNSNKYVYF